MYASSVLSWTIAPCGQPARTRSRRRTASPGRASSRASSRNSVGVSAHARSRRGDRVRRRVEPQPAGLERAVAARPPQERVQPREQLGERERLRQVVVAAGVEAGEPVGERVARGQEEHGRVDAAGAQRLADVAPVGVGQPDVDDQRVRQRVLDARAAQSRPVPTARPRSPPRAGRASRTSAQLGVVLDDQDRGAVTLAESSRAGSRRAAGAGSCGAASAGGARAPPATAAPPRPARNAHGTAR